MELDAYAIGGGGHNYVKLRDIGKAVDFSVSYGPYTNAAIIVGGIYHRLQIDPTYNSNHIVGSERNHDQTRYIFETNTIGAGEAVKVNDVVETANHFKCIDMIIDSATHTLRKNFNKQLHAVLKSGTSDFRLDWFAVGDYKRIPNEAGGKETTAPEQTDALGTTSSIRNRPPACAGVRSAVSGGRTSTRLAGR